MLDAFFTHNFSCQNTLKWLYEPQIKELKELDRRRKLEAQKNYYDNQAEKCDRISEHSLDKDNKRTYKKRAQACKQKADEIGGKIAEFLEKSDGSGIMKMRKTTLPVNIQLFADIPKENLPNMHLTLLSNLIKQRLSRRL